MDQALHAGTLSVAEWRHCSAMAQRDPEKIKLMHNPHLLPAPVRKLLQGLARHEQQNKLHTPDDF